MVALVLVAQLSGCATTMPVLELEHHKVNKQTRIEPVPFVAQRRKQCGAASLAMALSYRGVAVTARELEPYVYLPEREGAVSLELVTQTRRFGQLAYEQKLSMPGLLEELDAGNPVIVLMNLGLSWLPQWHFAVVTGYDLKRRELVLHSGETANKRVAFKTFYNTWSRSGFWSLLVMPPDQIPATAEMSQYLQAASALEQVGQPDAARRAYQAALQRWPDSAQTEIARLGLANIEYHHNNPVAAQRWLLDSIRQGVATAFTWNNLAYVLAELGCADAARASLECALKGESGKVRELADSRKEIENMLRGHHLENPHNESLCIIPDCRGISDRGISEKAL